MVMLVSDVRGLAPGSYEALAVFGGASLDDGIGGLYYWDSAATSADDGAEWIKPISVDAGSPGRWHRIEPYALSTHTHPHTHDLPPQTEAGTTVNSAAADDDVWKRWTNASPKTLTIIDDTHAAGDVLHGINIGAGLLTITAGAGVTLTGSYLTFAQNRPYAIVFSAVDAADVIASDSTTGGDPYTDDDALNAVGINLVDSTSINFTYTAGVSITADAIFGSTATTVAAGNHTHVRSLVTDATTARTNLATDSDKWVEFTGTAAKTYTITNVAAATDVLAFFNAGATGNVSLTGSGVTLNGNLVFAPLTGGLIYFKTTTTASVVGGTTS